VIKKCYKELKKMKILLITTILTLIIGCSTTEDVPFKWEIKEETSPLKGCKDLREEHKDKADC